jgi:hypothetical protein
MSPLVRKILLTLAGGVLAYLISDLISLDVAFQVATSIFVGGVIFVAAYLVDVDQRLVHLETKQSQVATSTELLFKQGFTKINEATELFGLVEASALRSDVMTQLVRNSTQIDGKVPSLVFSFAQAEIGRLSELLRELSNGSDVVYEGEDRDWMLGLTRNAVSSIDAISLTTVDAGTDGGLWMTDLGQRYLQYQQEAIKRGVTIRRIFVTDKPDLLAKKEFLDVCDMHRRMGIQVKVLDAADAPGTRANTMFDFIVFDGVISYESTPASVTTNRLRQPIIINTRLVQQQSRVTDRIQRFHELWSSSREIQS